MPININNSAGEKVIDPYNSKYKFDKHHETRIAAFSDKDKPFIEKYIDDMKRGKNISMKSKRGGRGYIHLNTLLSRLTTISDLCQEHFKKSLTELTADDLHSLFVEGMQEGKILKSDKTRYKSTHDYVKIFKAFWNWYCKINRMQGKTVDNITIDLTGSADHKPDFVFFKLDSLKKMMNEAKFDHKVLMLFMFDSGMRVTEMLNIKGKDIKEIDKSDKLEVEIREETSKTFGRKIKLMLASELMKEYIKKHDVQDDDFVFKIKPFKENLYLKRLSLKVFGENLKGLKENKKSKKYITLYDFRHSSCCHWLPIYKTEAALKWRFGWKKSDMIYYYSEFLNMKDNLTEEDMLTDVSKTELEKQLQQEQQKSKIMEDRMAAMERQMALLLKKSESEDNIKKALEIKKARK